MWWKWALVLALSFGVFGEENVTAISLWVAPESLVSNGTCGELGGSPECPLAGLQAALDVAQQLYNSSSPGTVAITVYALPGTYDSETDNALLITTPVALRCVLHLENCLSWSLTLLQVNRREQCDIPW
jgi:hypothetical protein